MDEVHNDAKILSFIIRIWREESNTEGRPAIWRGHITPIPGGNHHYFVDLEDIPAFIAARLKEQR
jgi:hypothetical protein